MRIIEKKTVKEKEVKETCFTCKTKFAYTADDTEIDRDGKYVKCPNCGVFIESKF